MTRLSDAFGQLLDRHRALGSPVPDLLRSGASAEQVAEAEARLGLTLHPDVVELLGLADGIDEDLWAARYPGQPAYLVPSLLFPGLAGSAEVAQGLRDVAAELERQGEEPGLWDPAWFPVFPIWSDEAVVVDCSDGTVWLVWWESVQVHQVAHSLADYLELCGTHMAEHEVVFEAATGQLRLPRGVRAARAPLEPMPGGIVRLS